MKCPECGSTSHFVTETRRQGDDGIRRRRHCRTCRHRWTTIEREDCFDPTTRQWEGRAFELPPIIAQPQPKQAPRPKFSAFWPVTLDQSVEVLAGMPPDIATGFLEWWNSARRSRHAHRIAWTERAFAFSAERVKALPHWAQQILVNAGIEHGWQALKPDYIKAQLDKGPPGQGAGFRPQSQGLAGALSILEGGRRP